MKYATEIVESTVRQLPGYGREYWVTPDGRVFLEKPEVFLNYPKLRATRVPVQELFAAVYPDLPYPPSATGSAHSESPCRILHGYALAYCLLPTGQVLEEIRASDFRREQVVLLVNTKQELERIPVHQVVATVYPEAA